VAGCELYVEATIFTKADPSIEKTGAFPFDPAEQQQSEGVALRDKVIGKGQQYSDAEKPALLLVAEGLVTTGLTMERDPRDWAMSHLGFRGGAPGISAVAFTKDTSFGRMALRVNRFATHPLPLSVVEWIEEKGRSGWLS
jgi:hypothetical protein